MTKEERIAYEAWLKENNVPDYMRSLYHDDPIKIRDAMMRKREKEYEKHAEEVAKKKSERTGEPVPEKKPVVKKPIEDTDDWEEDTSKIYGKKEPVKKQKKFYAEDAEKSTKTVKVSPKTKKTIILILIGLALTLAFVWILIAITKGRTKAKFEVAYIQKGILENNGSGNAFFIRNTKTIASPDEGVFVAKIEEGKRVEAGGVIGYITAPENKNVVDKLSAVKQQIVALRNAEESVVTTKELAEANAKIVEQKNKLEEMAERGTFSGYEEALEELTARIAARDEILLATESADVNITELQKLKAEYEQIIDKKMQPVKSEKPGIVSYFISGNEPSENLIYELFIGGKYDEKTDLLEMFTTKENTNYAGKTVTKGQIICKVVLDQEYFAVVDTDEKTAAELSGVITLTNSTIGYEAGSTVVNSGGTRVVISSLRDMKTTMPYEQTSVGFSLSSKSGYSVPTSALTDWDKNNQTARLAIVRAKTVKFVYVGVAAFDEKNAIITNAPFKDTEITDPDGNEVETDDDSFRTGDCYVVNAEKVKEGQQID